MAGMSWLGAGMSHLLAVVAFATFFFAFGAGHGIAIPSIEVASEPALDASEMTPEVLEAQSLARFPVQGLVLGGASIIAIFVGAGSPRKEL